MARPIPELEPIRHAFAPGPENPNACRACNGRAREHPGYEPPTATRDEPSDSTLRRHEQLERETARSKVAKFTEGGWQKKCVDCGGNFLAKRIDVQFCSPKCRVRHYRKNGNG